MAEEQNDMVVALGKRVKQNRERVGITLKELAEKTGVTPSLLSQIENGKASPSLSTLKSIADVFSIPIGSLFDAAPARTALPPVTRRNAHRRIITEGNIRHDMLSAPLNDFEALLIEFPVGATTGGAPYSHDGTECAYLIRGELVIELDGVEHELQPGDSIVFESFRKHKITNRGKEPALTVWVDSRPWFFSHEQ